MGRRFGRRSFLAMVAGGTLIGRASSEPPARRVSCSDADSGRERDPAQAHGADADAGPPADPVARFAYQDAADTGPSSDAPSGRRTVRRCPDKRQAPAR